MIDKIQYGNWIRKRVLWILGLGSLGLGILGVFPFPPALRVILEAGSIVLFVSFLYPAYLYYCFSPQGENVQEKVYDLIVERLGEAGTGPALDIGTGNGILAIKLAQRYPQARVTGMDTWGKNWEYSRSVCEGNARLSNVSDRLTFVKGSAAALGFPDATFDIVVSNLTFHEVGSIKDKRELVTEALRVLRTGGKFVFVDYFQEGRYYGEAANFRDFLQGLGLKWVEAQPLREVLAFPRPLRHPKAFGKAGIVYGVK
jgi:SAM-dependent methyltransferase